MSANLQQYFEYLNQTEEEFNKWNLAQPPTRQILNRLPWTIKFNDAIFAPGFEKKAYVGKDGNSGTNSFKKIKQRTPEGAEISYKVQSPSVICPRGYTELKTEKGNFKVMICIYDTTNPEHARFLKNIEDHLTTPAIYEIMRYPVEFGFSDFNAFSSFDAGVLASEQFKDCSRDVSKKMSKIVNKIKISKTAYDHSSPLRSVFVTPMYFKDPEKPTEPAAEMVVNLKLRKGAPPHVITPAQLFMICEGWEEKEVPVQKMINGFLTNTTEKKLVKCKPKGMEFSPELYFSKLNAGVKPSTKMLCTSVTITRFQSAPKIDTQGDKSAAYDKTGVEDDFTLGMNMESLLGLLPGMTNPNKGDSTESTSSTVTTATADFNPMGNSNITSTVSSGGGSLVSAMSQQTVTPSLQFTTPASTSVEQSHHSPVPINSLTMTPSVGIQQLAPPVMPQPFNGSNFSFPSTVQSSAMPSINIGMVGGTDRLQSFGSL